MRRVFRYAIELFVIGAVIYGLAVMSFYVLQRRLIYQPDATHYTPSDGGLAGVSEVILETRDGVRLVAWYSPAAPGKPTLLYFHGNGAGLLNRSERIKLFASEGYGVFMPSYRGYSGSSGEPSETAIIADAALAYDYLTGKGLTPGEIVLYGESLGTGVAVQTAASHPVAGVVLELPYTSLVDVAKSMYPFLPAKPFMVDSFNSTAHIEQVHAPLLIIHGEKDQLIPPKLGERLFAMANDPKEMALIAKGSHYDLYRFGAFAIVRRFIDAHAKPTVRGQ